LLLSSARAPIAVLIGSKDGFSPSLSTQNKGNSHCGRGIDVEIMTTEYRLFSGDDANEAVSEAFR
jgi:hypothetical protein